MWGNDPSFDERIFEIGWFNHLAGFFFTHIIHQRVLQHDGQDFFSDFLSVSLFRVFTKSTRNVEKTVNVLLGSFLWFLVAKYKIQAGKLTVGSRNPFKWWLKKTRGEILAKNCPDKSRIQKNMAAGIWFELVVFVLVFWMAASGYSSSHNHGSGEWVPTRLQ